MGVDMDENMTMTLHLIARDAQPDDPPLPGSCAYMNVSGVDGDTVSFDVHMSPATMGFLAVAKDTYEDDADEEHGFMPRYELTSSGAAPALEFATLSVTPMGDDGYGVESSCPWWLARDAANGAIAVMAAFVDAAAEQPGTGR